MTLEEECFKIAVMITEMEKESYPAIVHDDLLRINYCEVYIGRVQFELDREKYGREESN